MNKNIKTAIKRQAQNTKQRKKTHGHRRKKKQETNKTTGSKIKTDSFFSTEASVFFSFK